MSRLKVLMFVLSLSALPLFADPAAAPVKSPNLRIRTGLWQSTVTTNISGELPIPDDVLARMTPEQRKSIQDQMTASKAQNAKPRVSQICITQEKLNNGFQLDNTTHPNCKRTIMADTATAMEVHEVCTENGGTTDVSIHYRALTPESLEGTNHVEMVRQGKTMVSDGTIQGKWLGADCGDVK